MNKQTNFWTPVSEGLPEKYGEYLITWRRTRYKKNFLSIAEWAEGYEWNEDAENYDGEWIVDKYISFYGDDYEVIAWAPLPEPYVEEK